MQPSPLSSGTYVIAVSGGIDSVALLHYLKNVLDIKLIVAHVDHGIRSNSDGDALFVKQLAKDYELTYESIRYELGANASEEKARQARYTFLYRMCEKYHARSVITAHHANDVVETMMINIIRGTGWRGLASLKNTPEVSRPLLEISKNEIRDYAMSHHLQWVEDETNSNDRYLRNRIRKYLMPHVDIAGWLALYKEQCRLQKAIDQEITLLSTHKRHSYIMWPNSVSFEILRALLHTTRPQTEYALWKIKTAKPGTLSEIGSGKNLQFTRDSFVIK